MCDCLALLKFVFFDDGVKILHFNYDFRDYIFQIKILFCMYRVTLYTQKKNQETY